MQSANLKPLYQWMLLGLLVLGGSLSQAYAACCTGHGGVASCDKTVGKKMCKDGTLSPTCTCKKERVSKPKATKPAATVPVTKKSMSTPSTQKPASKGIGSWWGGKSSTTPSSGTSAKGCCSRHGGISHCDQTTGKQMCKDGSQSPSCVCH